MVQLTQADSTVVYEYDYDTFGNQLVVNENDNNPLRYNGQYWDEETQTYYLRARQYNPVTGRFTTEDSYWTVGNMIYDENGSISMEAILQAGNLYVYCMGNPVMFVDPVGEDAYIYYTSKDEISATVALDSYSELKATYGTVHFINVNTPDDFYKGWASMGWKTDGTQVNIDYVGVFLHGNEYYMLAGDDQAIYGDSTVSKKIDKLFILSCYAGAKVTVGTNVVDQFIGANNITSLVAANKEVKVLYNKYSGNIWRIFVSGFGNFYRYTKDGDKIFKTKLKGGYSDIHEIV